MSCTNNSLRSINASDLTSMKYTVIVYLCFNRKFEIRDFEFSVKT